MKKKQKQLQTRKKTRKKNQSLRNNIERYFYNLGFKSLVGIDEVGRGAWAGPLVACAVQLPANANFKKLRDSKLLSYLEKEKLAKELKRACQFSLGVIKVEEINKHGLAWANKAAFERAIAKFPGELELALVDGLRMKTFAHPYKAIIDGDNLCASIAAASIIAKDFRDKMMIRLAIKHSQWGFEQHKGYGTKRHMEMLKKHGVSKIHRLNYKPIKKISRRLNDQTIN